MNLFLATLRYRLREDMRYPFQFALNYASFLLLGYLLGLSSTSIIENPNYTVSMAAGGFFLSFISGGAITIPVEILTGNKTKVEEIFIRPMNTIFFLTITSIARSLESVITISLMAFAIGMLRNEGYEVALRLIAVGLPTFFSMIGIGLAVSGFKLLFQKIGSLSQLIWLFLMGSSLGASDSLLRATSFFSPFSASLLFIRTGQLNTVMFLVMSFILFAIGSYILILCENTALRRGIISQD